MPLNSTLDDTPVSPATINVPSYRRHKASGNAVVTLGGLDFYLGAYGSAASKAEYKRLIGEYLAGHGCPPAAQGKKSDAALAVTEVALAYGRYCKATHPRVTWRARSSQG